MTHEMSANGAMANPLAVDEPGQHLDRLGLAGHAGQVERFLSLSHLVFRFGSDDFDLLVRQYCGISEIESENKIEYISR